jgi:hypothetical protein
MILIVILLWISGVVSWFQEREYLIGIFWGEYLDLNSVCYIISNFYKCRWSPNIVKIVNPKTL